MSRLVVVLAGFLALCSASTHAVLRTIEFVASDFKTQQDDPTDFRSTGDPFGIFGLAQPDQISGSIVFDTDSSPVRGPETTNTGTEFELDFVRIPYVSFSTRLGPDVEILAAQSNFGDSILVGDGIGASVGDRVFFESSTDQTLSVGIKVTSMQIQLAGNDPGVFTGLDVPSPAEINAIVGMMPSFDEKFRLNMFDANGISHKLVAFNIIFSEVPVPEPSTLGLLGVGLLGLMAKRRRRSSA